MRATRTLTIARRGLCSTRESFIARAARTGDARAALLGPFRSAGRFDVCLEDGMVCTSIGDGVVECELEVREPLANVRGALEPTTLEESRLALQSTSLRTMRSTAQNYGTLHGGAISTIVDVVGTMALLSVDPSKAGVSVEMNQTFCSAAAVGEKLSLTGRTLRYGRSLAFAEVEVRKWPTGREVEGELPALVAVGRHTKMFPPAKAK